MVDENNFRLCGLLNCAFELSLITHKSPLNFIEGSPCIISYYDLQPKNAAHNPYMSNVNSLDIKYFYKPFLDNKWRETRKRKLNEYKKYLIFHKEISYNYLAGLFLERGDLHQTHKQSVTTNNRKQNFFPYAHNG